MTDKHETDLFSDPKSFGKQEFYFSLLSKQYELYVTSTDKFTSFRNQANTFFLTINTLIVGFIASVFELSESVPSSEWQSLFAVMGIIVCLTWYFMVRSYRTLNSARFKLIHQIEEIMPLRLYQSEWEILMRNKPKHIPQTHIEQIVPISLIFLYMLYLTITLV